MTTTTTIQLDKLYNVQAPGSDRQRVAWVLSARLPGRECTHELQVRHDAVDTTMRFVREDAAVGEAAEVLTDEQWQERLADIAVNEPVECEACAALTGAEQEAKWDSSREDDLGFSCRGCRKATFENAERLLADVAVRGTDAELRLRDDMVARWQAFALLFNPAYTL